MATKNYKDPYCSFYKAIYQYIQSKLMQDLISDENLVATQKYNILENNILFKKGKYISLTNKTHPKQKADNSKLIIALYYIGKGFDSDTIASKMIEQKYSYNFYKTKNTINSIKLYINQKANHFNKLYIHITSKCNLSCNHCYNNSQQETEIDIEVFQSLVKQAITIGFKYIVLTGGEPTLHSKFSKILEVCRNNKNKNTKFTLRSNFCTKNIKDYFTEISNSFDDIKISLDGDESTHNSQRNSNSYHTIISNISLYNELKLNNSGAKISITCVTKNVSDNIIRSHLNSVAYQNSIKKVKIKPLLPIGRGKNESVNFKNSLNYIIDENILEENIFPKVSCGVENSLNIKVNGDVYPCFALYKNEYFLGNSYSTPLGDIINSNNFKNLKLLNMNNFSFCISCEYRYICGGVCQAWINNNITKDEFELKFCKYLKPIAIEIVQFAKNYLEED